MSTVMNIKSRTSWIAAGAVLFLIWTMWSVPSSILSAPSLFSSETKSKGNGLSSTGTKPPSSLHEQTNTSAASDRPLIIYAFFETELALTNLKFFIAHGLHGGADFLFVLNGQTNASDIIPDEPNISYVQRKNECYDLGAFSEVLLSNDLYKKYNRFITMNASIRGPFLPYWSNGCWSDMYLSRVTDDVKLVGMTMNCQPWLPPHVQSMIWATDRIGLETLLFPSAELIEKFNATLPPHNDQGPVPAMESPGINSCPSEYWKAVAIEVYATPLIRAAGYEVDVMMSAFHGSEEGIAGYEAHCFETGDVVWPGKYYGMDLHPFDTVFAKSNRGTGELVLERLTQWTKGRKYSSYDYCPS